MEIDWQGSVRKGRGYEGAIECGVERPACMRAVCCLFEIVGIQCSLALYCSGASRSRFWMHLKEKYGFCPDSHNAENQIF